MSRLTKIKLTRKSAEQLTDLGIELGIIHKGDREEQIKLHMTEMECIIG